MRVKSESVYLPYSFAVQKYFTANVKCLFREKPCTGNSNAQGVESWSSHMETRLEALRLSPTLLSVTVCRTTVGR